MRWLIRSARKCLLAGLLAGASFQPASLHAQQRLPLLPDPMEGLRLMPAADAGGQPPKASERIPAPTGQAAPRSEIIPAPAGAPSGMYASGDDPSITPGGPPIEGPAGAAAADGKDDCKPMPFWQGVPQYEKFPLPGWFVLPPNGPGYYSLADVLLDNYRKAPPRYPYPRFSIIPFSMFNVDWRYLDDPNNEEHDYFDFLKRIHLGDDFLFTTGGEFRFRYNNEVDSRLTGKNNTYNLERTRVYGDFWYQDKFRVFVETLDARSQNQDLAPLAIDVDHFSPELLNAFIDVKLATIDGAPVYGRVGRQELLYGSQRLISPLDFANTRRTFQGVKAFWHDECFGLDLDAFCVQPVIPNPTRFDSVDDRQVFSGLWGTYHPRKNQLVDLYYLNLDNSNRTAQMSITRAPINVSTLGSRYAGDYDGRWLWEAEAMMQFGSIEGAPGGGDRALLAHADAVGFGYCFKDCPWKPQVWAYYEYASGDKTPNVGEAKTFQQLFPFGHYYFGGTDQVGRQNINDANAQFVFFPAKWITCLAQYHILRLDSATDALYNAGGVAIRRDPTGRAGTDVGEVLDLVVNFHLDKHQDIFIQNAHLYSGDFIKRTGSPRDLNSLFVQYSYRW